LIFDEVVTGFRHSLGGYQEVCGVIPDLATLGKAMANGYPMAALCGKRVLMERFRTCPGGDVFFGGTFGGHPMGCAAALASIEVLEDRSAYKNLFRLGERILSGLDEIVRLLGIRATGAGFGSVFVLYFMEGPIVSYKDLIRNDRVLFEAYRSRLVERGVLELPSNLKRSSVSLSHTDQHVETTLQVCEDTLKELKNLAN